MLRLNLQRQSDHPNLILPKRATYKSAGYDIYSPVNVWLNPGESTEIRLGFTWNPKWSDLAEPFMTMFNGAFAKIFDKSGHAYKFKFGTMAGVIDFDFCRDNSKSPDFKDVEWQLICYNLGTKPFECKIGEKLTQFVLLPYLVAEDETEHFKVREGGLGSTGK